jgi:cell wall-associated NlpC family hydrolase
VVAAAALVLPVAVSVALPGPAAPPSADDVPTATRLAVAAHGTLMSHGEQWRQLDAERAQRQAELDAAVAERAAAGVAADAARGAVGTAAADLFRDAPQVRLPVLGLDSGDPASVADVLYRQALADRAGTDREGAVVRAERAGAVLATAARAVSAAEREVAAVDRRAERLLDEARAAAADLDPAVAATVSGLSERPATADEQDRGRRAVSRWQAYLSTLASAGIEPPAAAALADPEQLPAGLAPALDAAGQPVPGVAWAVVGSSPVTVLPAETVAAVSAALSQLGKPYVPGTAGPDTYDCGGFTSAAWLLGGYAVPATPGQQWATGAPVDPATLQVGDLVFSDGGADVGIYLGEGAVLGASAGTYQVGVRAMVPGSSAVRVTLPAPAQPNAPLLVSGAHGACGAPLPVAGPVSAAWGGWSNGRIPSSALCALGSGRHALRCDAAAGYLAMGRAYAAAFGTPLCITDSYRSMAAQQSAFERKPALAAVPGTSNHGWALAVDLCGGINVAGTPQWTWMTANAGAFGFVQPDWARPGGEKPEPWHWEFGNLA